MKHVEDAQVAVWTGTGWNLRVLSDSLLQMGCRVRQTDSFQELWRLMESQLDLVIVHCQNAPDVLHWMRGVRLAGTSAPPVLTVATSFEVDEYLKAMSLGAFDCVALPVQEKELRRLVDRAMQERYLEPLLLPA